MWNRWIAEYVSATNNRHVEAQPIRPRDLVYIAEKGVRKCWTRGVVREVYPGVDGRVRQALEKTVKGEFRHPVAKLEMLEIQECNSDVGESPSNYGEGEFTEF